jgi:HAD superfamily hydrolase (TIGR01509 family)
LKTAEKLGVAPANALVIEDSVNGVRSGKAAGLSGHRYCDFVFP